MPVSMPQSHAPNSTVINFTPGDNTAWHLVTGFPGLPPGARYVAATVRSVATGGATDGSPFQVLYNQAAQPANGTAGKLISGSGQTETLPGALYNLYVKASVATDIIQVEVFF